MIANNKWCVKFVHVNDDEEEVAYDLVQEFTVRFWMKYTAKMVEHLHCLPCLFNILSLTNLFTLFADRTTSRHSEVGAKGTRVPHL